MRVESSTQSEKYDVQMTRVEKQIEMLEKTVFYTYAVGEPQNVFQQCLKEISQIKAQTKEHELKINSQLELFSTEISRYGESVEDTKQSVKSFEKTLNTQLDHFNLYKA